MAPVKNKIFCFTFPPFFPFLSAKLVSTNSTGYVVYEYFLFSRLCVLATDGKLNYTPHTIRTHFNSTLAGDTFVLMKIAYYTRV